MVNMIGETLNQGPSVEEYEISKSTSFQNEISNNPTMRLSSNFVLLTAADPLPPPLNHKPTNGSKKFSINW